MEQAYFRSDLENLTRNPVWKELKASAAELIAGLEQDLRTLDPFTQPSEMARKQGIIQGIENYFDGWIADIKKDIEEYEEETRNGSK